MTTSNCKSMEPINPYASPDPTHDIGVATWQRAPLVDEWLRFPGNQPPLAVMFDAYGQSHLRAFKKLAAVPIAFQAFFGSLGVLGLMSAWMALDGDFAITAGMCIGLGAGLWITLRTYFARRKAINSLLGMLTKSGPTVIEWHANHLVFMNDRGRTVVQLEGLRNMRWLDGVLAVQVGPVVWFMFPDGWHTPGDRRAVANQLKSRLKSSRDQAALRSFEHFTTTALPLRDEQRAIYGTYQKQWHGEPILPTERIVFGSKFLAPALGVEHLVTRRPYDRSSRWQPQSFVGRTLMVFAVALLIGLPLVVLILATSIMFENDASYVLMVIVIVIAILVPLIILARFRRGRKKQPEGVMIGGGLTLFSEQGVYQVTADAVIYSLWGSIIEFKQAAQQVELRTINGSLIRVERTDFTPHDWQRLLEFAPRHISPGVVAADEPRTTADEISLLPRSGDYGGS
jgi:hypothetical protein